MGVTKEILAEGSGATPTKGANVTVHCTGYGKDNDLSKKFWSTQDPGQEPFAFQVGLGQVIKGWDEGVLSMKLGEKARLTCSPDYAYGARGFPAWGYPSLSLVASCLASLLLVCTCTTRSLSVLVSLTHTLCTIQPNSTLIFEIEVLKIE